MQPRSLLETVLAGVLYVTIGTLIALKVEAAGSASCETNQAPDAMCTLPLTKGPELKVCFSRSRCFEVKDSHLIQTVHGTPIQDAALTPAQTAQVKSSITSYQAWLESQLAKPAGHGCHDVTTIDNHAQHKEFCISKIARKEAEAHLKDLLLTLENPVRTSSAP